MRSVVQRDISGFAVPYYCHDELGIDLSGNHPNCIADKVAPPNVIMLTPLVIRHRRLHVDSSRPPLGMVVVSLFYVLFWGVSNFSPTKHKLPTLSPSVNLVGTTMRMTFPNMRLRLVCESPVVGGIIGNNNQLIPLKIFSTDTVLHIEVQDVVIVHGRSSSWLESSK